MGYHRWHHPEHDRACVWRGYMCSLIWHSLGLTVEKPSQLYWTLPSNFPLWLYWLVQPPLVGISGTWYRPSFSVLQSRWLCQSGHTAAVMCSIGYLSHCLTEREKGHILFSFREYSHCMGREWEQEAAGHVVSTLRGWRVKDSRIQLVFHFFISPGSMEWYPNIFLPQ